MKLFKGEMQPSETKDFYIDYSPWFAGRPPRRPARNDQPASITAAFATAGITLVSSSLTGQVVKIVASGIAPGKFRGRVLLTTTATPPIVKEADFEITVKEI